MKFTYTYRSSDGQRHTAEIVAESRDAAFAKVRTELGIKPIKVVAAEGESGALGDRALPDGRNKRYRWIWGAAILAAAILAVVVGIWWWGRAARPEAAPYQVMTPQGAVTLSVATPLPRQAIPGNRRKIEEAVAQERDPPVFRFAAERWLARYAEPGRKPPATGGTPVVPVNGQDARSPSETGGTPVAPDAAKIAAPHTSRPSSADFETALREPIRIASTDFTEVVDLKRIVTGMKREMRAYIAGGGTVEQYLAELEKRQRLEISYRDNAERRPNEMLKGQDARSPSATGGTPVVPDAAKMAAPHVGGTPVSGQDARGRDSLKAAYAYWLKANAQLQAMGIYPLALPDALRPYQMSLDIEE